MTSTNLNSNLNSKVNFNGDPNGDPAVSSSSILGGSPRVSAALYARVSSARQKKDETIGSQTAALREYVAAAGLAVPEQWVFEDDGHSGATLTRPALERLRDLVAGVGVDVVVCYSPDRLARKFAYQALLIEEFTRAGTRVEFVKGPRGDSPEDQLLVQFQGMFAEYEKAQIMERYRRGKAHRARAGSVSVLSGAPYGYRYLRKTPHTPAGYEIVAHEAVLVREVFRRYTDDGASIAELARWLGEQGAPTRTGKTRWDRSVIWGILRNPAYAGQAVYGKTKAINEPAAVNRVARQAGRTSGRAIRVVDRPAEDWVHIPVPAIITTETFERAGQRLADNKRFASRNTKVPSLLQGLAACSGCGYAYYRTSTRTTNKKIYYYRCLGSDDYRYEGGRVCANKPVRADHLDQTVWDHITTLLADPSLIRTEINRRLDTARTSDPVTHQRQRLTDALTQAAATVNRMISAYQEQLITIDELRARIPDLRAREASLRTQIDALDSQLADRQVYLKLADDLEGFLTGLRHNADTADVPERQRVLRLLVKDVLVGPEKITIRHRIPVREHTPTPERDDPTPDTEGDERASCPLRWGRGDRPLRGSGGVLPQDAVLTEDPRLQERLHQVQDALVGDACPHPVHEGRVRDLVEAGLDVALHDPFVLLGREETNLGHRIMSPASRTEPVGTREEIRLEDRLQHQFQGCLDHPVGDRGDSQPAKLAAGFGDHPLTHRQRPEAAVTHLRPQLVEELLNALHRLDRRGGSPVDPGGGGTLVAPHPLPRHQQERGISDEVVQIIEPAMRIITGPSVQLGLDLQYPSLRLKQRVLQFVGVHRRCSS